MPGLVMLWLFYETLVCEYLSTPTCLRFLNYKQIYCVHNYLIGFPNFTIFPFIQVYKLGLCMRCPNITFNRPQYLLHSLKSGYAASVIKDHQNQKEENQKLFLFNLCLQVTEFSCIFAIKALSSRNNERFSVTSYNSSFSVTAAIATCNCIRFVWSPLTSKQRLFRPLLCL